VRDIFRRQFFLRARDHRADLAGIDEEGFAAAVAVAALFIGFFVFGEEPEADGDLGGVEELAREGDHAVDEVVLDHLLADLTFALGIGGHGAIGEDEACGAIFRELGDHVENPSVVSITSGWGVVAVPASVVDEFIGGAPVLQIEGRICHNEISLEVGVLILEEGVGGYFAEVGREAAHSEVHPCQLVGGGGELLPVDGDVLLAAVAKLDGLDENAEQLVRNC